MITAYILGIVVGLQMIHERIIPVIKDFKSHLKWILVINTIFNLVPLYTMLYNTFGLIPKSLTFTVVLVNRSALPIGFAMGFVYLIACKPKSEKKEPESNCDQKETVTFMPLKAFSRLSFSLYICNYLVIRTLFFTTRNTLPTTLFSLVSKNFIRSTTKKIENNGINQLSHVYQVFSFTTEHILTF